jgi:hypothetical protein
LFFFFPSHLPHIHTRILGEVSSNLSVSILTRFSKVMLSVVSQGKILLYFAICIQEPRFCSQFAFKVLLLCVARRHVRRIVVILRTNVSFDCWNNGLCYVVFVINLCDVSKKI